MARYATEPAPGDWSFSAPFDDCMKRQEKQLAELQKTSDSLKIGEVVGALISFPAGDGHAFYLVAKDKPLTVAHVPYGDAWETSYITIKGLDRGDVLMMLGHDKKIKKLFKQKGVI